MFPRLPRTLRRLFLLCACFSASITLFLGLRLTLTFQHQGSPDLRVPSGGRQLHEALTSTDSKPSIGLQIKTVSASSSLPFDQRIRALVRNARNLMTNAKVSPIATVNPLKESKIVNPHNFKFKLF